jgi:hypothetical protein
VRVVGGIGEVFGLVVSFALKFSQRKKVVTIFLQQNKMFQKFCYKFVTILNFIGKLLQKNAWVKIFASG